MTDYKVKDINLADFGDKEISLAESEMPGLMAIRRIWKFKTTKRSKYCWVFAHDNSNSCFD